MKRTSTSGPRSIALGQTPISECRFAAGHGAGTGASRTTSENKSSYVEIQSERLKKDWETWRDLKLNSPRLQPAFLRLYQETLCVTKATMRRRSDRSGVELKTNLGEIAVLIRKARTLDGRLDCVGPSFPMPRVLGFRQG